MNALRTHDRNPSSTAPRSNVVPAMTPSRPPRRERDFGVGYGNSSGYAGPRPYIADNGPRLFRCA